MATDGESSSSAGSDKAPSEDNLDPEEIQMVVPELDDDFSPFKRKKTLRKDQILGAGMLGPGNQDTATSVSPLRRKGTTVVESSNPIKKAMALKVP